MCMGSHCIVVVVAFGCGKDFVAPNHHAAFTRDFNGIPLNDPSSCEGC